MVGLRREPAEPTLRTRPETTARGRNFLEEQMHSIEKLIGVTVKMDSANDLRPIYSAGDCPVCADSGALILLKARDSGRTFFFCPLCGVAWLERPRPAKLDSILSLTDIAPKGATLASLEEASSIAGPLTELPFDAWYPLVKDDLLS